MWVQPRVVEPLHPDHRVGDGLVHDEKIVGALDARCELGAKTMPPTMSNQPEDASVCGVMFQSPPTIHGPRTAAMAAATLVNTAALVSPIPSPSFRYSEKQCTPPFTTAPTQAAPMRCWNPSATKSCGMDPRPLREATAVPPEVPSA